MLAVGKGSTLSQNIAEVRADLLRKIDFVVEPLGELKDTQTCGKRPIFVIGFVLSQTVLEQEEYSLQIYAALIYVPVEGRIQRARFPERVDQCVANSCQITQELRVNITTHQGKVLRLGKEP